MDRCWDDRYESYRYHRDHCKCPKDPCCDYVDPCEGSWFKMLHDEINDNVLVVLTSGGGYSAVTGVLARVYPGFIVLINNNVIIEIPMDRIAAVSKLAGGGPVPPTVGGFGGIRGH